MSAVRIVNNGRRRICTYVNNGRRRPYTCDHNGKVQLVLCAFVLRVSSLGTASQRPSSRRRPSSTILLDVHSCYGRTHLVGFSILFVKV